MDYTRGELIHEGKAKRVFAVNGQEDLIWLEFKDDLTAFNAEKTGSFEGKGQVNLAITENLFAEFKRYHIPTHWVSKVSATELVVRKLEMIPLEVVVRNILAGSTAKKFDLKEGTELEQSIVELFYKSDELGDPFMNEDQALMLKAVDSKTELEQIKQMALDVNDILVQTFLKADIRLVDFKIELGKNSKGQILLADEVTPDSCRLWDKSSQKKLDKDRFRRDLGSVKESYEEVLARLTSDKKSEATV